jgi:hypothetical protein
MLFVYAAISSTLTARIQYVKELWDDFLNLEMLMAINHMKIPVTYVYL